MSAVPPKLNLSVPMKIHKKFCSTTQTEFLCSHENTQQVSSFLLNISVWKVSKYISLTSQLIPSYCAVSCMDYVQFKRFSPVLKLKRILAINS